MPTSNPSSDQIDLATRIDLTTLCGPLKLVAKGVAIDWDSVERSFDADGPFRLPPKPEWTTVDQYCSDVLVTTRTTRPEDRNDQAEGRSTSANGMNRFLYPFRPENGAPIQPVAINNVELLLYPASVHNAYDETGIKIGYFAPGLEFAAKADFADAAAVAADPRVQAAVRALLGECSKGQPACDATLSAAVAAGAAGLVGEPVTS